jgi:outer membrane autotransporter protein
MTADNNLYDGGTGAWNATNTNWTNVEADENGAYTSSAQLIFAGANGGTVTVDNTGGAVTIGENGVQFTADGYTITGGDLTLSGTAALRLPIIVNPGVNATIESALTGGSGIRKRGTGTLTLTGDSSYAGFTLVHEGTLEITGGGSIANAGGTVGDQAGDNAVARIDGPGSSWTSSGGNGLFYVGNNGTGQLTVSNGGRLVNTNFGLIGAFAGSAGTVTVDGAGSEWVNGGGLQIGNAGAGTLNITGGGKVSSANPSDIGVAPSGVGAVTVDGADSTWSSADLRVGVYGSGSLSIRNGGLVSAGDVGVADVNGATIGQGTINLDGTSAARGVLQTGSIGSGGGTAALDFNGGILLATRDEADFISGFAAGEVTIDAGGAFIDSNGFDIGIASALAGSGALTKQGLGTLTLTQTNNYTGATNVNAGTLKVDGSIASSGLTTVANNATLTGAGTVGATTVLSGGTLKGASGSNLTIAGHLDLQAGSHISATLDAPFADAAAASGKQLFTVKGVLTSNGSSIDITDAGNFGDGLYRIIDYTGGGSFDRGSNSFVTGGLAGHTVTVNTADAGYIDLLVSSGPPPQPGSGGPLRFWDGANTTANGVMDGGSGAWSATGANWTNLAADENGVYDPTEQLIFTGTAGTVTVDAGGVSVGADGVQFVADGYTVRGGNIALAGTARFAVNGGVTAAIDSALTGAGGLTKTGAGTLKLSGLNSYSGATTIQAGTLDNAGTIAGAVAVNGGFFRGTGSAGGLTVNNGGTVAPGNSIGTMKVDGPVTFNAGSTYEVEINAAGQSDLIQASGAATLNGGTVAVLAEDGNYAPSTDYTILSADGGVSGKFTGLTSNLAFLTPSLGYDDPNKVVLTMTRNQTPFAALAGTPNENAAGAGIESVGAGAAYSAVVGLSATQALAAFDELSGEIHASARTALIEDSRFVREAAIERLRAPGEELGAWARAFGSWGQWNGDGNAATLKRSIGGLVFGADAALSGGARLGVIGSYSRSGFDAGGRHSSGDSDNYSLGVYGGARWGDVALRSGAAYTRHDMSTRRSVGIGAFSDSLKSDGKANTTQVFGELGYGMQAGAMRLEPFANLAHVRLSSNRFTERGGAAALTGRGGSDSVTFATLGLHVDGEVDLGGTKATAKATLGWRHAFGDTTPRARLSFAGGDAFGVSAVPIARNAAVLDAGLEFGIGKNTALGVSYAGQIGSGVRDHGLRVDFRMKF